MIPSSSPGRARRAPAFRPFSAITSLLLFAFACSHAGSPKEARPAEPTKAALPAATSPTPTPTLAEPLASSPTSANREGGTGTRAKREEGARGQVEAPMERVDKPKSASSFAASPSRGATADMKSSGAASGAGMGLVGIGATGKAGPMSSSPASGAVGNRMRAVAQRPAVAPSVGPEFNTEAYAPLAENAFLAVKEHPLSTFSSDVDTASYSNARRFLGEGTLPPKDSIRVEEWLNYFSYAYAPPTGDAPVAIHTEVSECPWQPAHRLVRIGIKARPIEQGAVPPRNLVFLVDVSGSMMPANKLPLLKNGLAMLTRTLRPQDQVAMVVYAGSSGLALPATPGSKQNEILTALAGLEAGG